MLKNFALAAKVVLKNIVSPNLHVPKEEADRRASICARCPNNLPIAACWGCGSLGALYREIQGKRKTRLDSYLDGCDVCGCDNRTQVHFSAEVLKAIAEDQKIGPEFFPDFCWKKAALQQ